MQPIPSTLELAGDGANGAKSRFPPVNAARHDRRRNTMRAKATTPRRSRARARPAAATIEADPFPSDPQL
jgi:hypothetical protein